MWTMKEHSNFSSMHHRKVVTREIFDEWEVVAATAQNPGVAW